MLFIRSGRREYRRFAIIASIESLLPCSTLDCDCAAGVELPCGFRSSVKLILKILYTYLN
jgi:hypothetical protein